MKTKYDMALLFLLFYAYKYSWVRDKIASEDIDIFKRFTKKCSEEEIEDYIRVLKEQKYVNN